MLQDANVPEPTMCPTITSNAVPEYEETTPYAMADTLLAITQSIPTVQESPELTWNDAGPKASVKEVVDEVLY